MAKKYPNAARVGRLRYSDAGQNARIRRNTGGGGATDTTRRKRNENVKEKVRSET